jgi:RNA polymerase sigma-70 factor (ECF subfamily)
MEDTVHPIDPQQLAQHTERLRALVTRLVEDPARADDIVQETHLVALTRPQRRGVPLFAWLAGVARNLALHDRRATVRRTRHERTASISSGAISQPDDAVERADFLRVVLAELVALDEPYRATLLLRFVDGLEPREIAARTGVPGATVRSRLLRGVEILRERLDARHGGDRRRWLGLCAPLLSGRVGDGAGAGVGAAAKAAGATLMAGITTKILVGAAAAAVLIVAVVRIGERNAEVSRPSPAVASQETPGLRDAAPDHRGHPHRVGQTDEATSAATAAQVNSAARLRITVRREDGGSAVGARVLAWHGDAIDASDAAGQDGVVELPAADVDRNAVVAAPGHPLVRTNVPAGATSLEVLVSAGASVEGVVHVDGDTPKEAIQLTLHRERGLWISADEIPRAVAARLGDGAGYWTESVPTTTSDDGRFAFTGLAPGERVYVLAPWTYGLREMSPTSADFVPTAGFARRDAVAPARGIFLDLLRRPYAAGRVVRQGRPVAGAKVTLSVKTSDKGGCMSTIETSSDGRFLIPAPSFEILSMSIEVADQGRGRRTVDVPIENRIAHDLGDVELAEVRTVALHVHDDAGRAITGAIALAVAGPHDAPELLSDAPSDASGDLTIRVADSVTRVRVGALGFRVADVDVAGATAAPLDVRLSPTTVLVVEMTGALPGPLETTRLLFDASGPMFDTADGRDDALWVRAGAAPPAREEWPHEGSEDSSATFLGVGASRFTVCGLRPATSLRLRVLDTYGAQLAEQPLVLASGERRSIAITLPAPRRLSGRVVDRAGRAATGAWIIATYGESDPWSHPSKAIGADANGAFLFDDVRGERLSLCAYVGNNSTLAQANVTVDVPTDGRVLLVRLESGRPIRVTLRDAAGALVRDARVRAERPGLDGTDVVSSRDMEEESPGCYAANNAPTGSVSVVVKLDDGAVHRFPVAEAAEDVTLTLPRADATPR